MVYISRIRIICDITLFVGLFVFPFWLFATVAVVGLVLVPFYVEFLVAFTMLELLYGAGAKSQHAIYIAVIVVASFIFTQALRTFIRKRAVSF